MSLWTDYNREEGRSLSYRSTRRLVTEHMQRGFAGTAPANCWLNTRHLRDGSSSPVGLSCSLVTCLELSLVAKRCPPSLAVTATRGGASLLCTQQCLTATSVLFCSVLLWLVCRQKKLRKTSGQIGSNEIQTLHILQILKGSDVMVYNTRN